MHLRPLFFRHSLKGMEPARKKQMTSQLVLEELGSQIGGIASASWSKETFQRLWDAVLVKEDRLVLEHFMDSFHVTPTTLGWMLDSIGEEHTALRQFIVESLGRRAARVASIESRQHGPRAPGLQDTIPCHLARAIAHCTDTATVDAILIRLVKASSTDTGAATCLAWTAVHSTAAMKQRVLEHMEVLSHTCLDQVIQCPWPLVVEVCHLSTAIGTRVASFLSARYHQHSDLWKERCSQFQRRSPILRGLLSSAFASVPSKAHDA